MWHALRAELVYFRPWLFGALGLAVGVAALVSGIFYSVGEGGPGGHVAAGIRGMFLMMAPVILGFVILSLRGEEHRSRLLLAGPLTPRQMAGVNALISLVLFGIGALFAALMLGIDSFVTGGLALESVHLVGYVGGLIFMMQMVGLLINETVAAHRQLRTRASAAGWCGLILIVLVLAVLTVAAVIYQGPRTWPSLHLGNLLAAALAMAASVVLYAGRNDFTR